MIRFIFPSLLSWSVAVAKHASEAYPHWYHLDQFWRLRGDGFVSLVIEASACVGGELWTARCHLGTVAAGDGKSQQALLEQPNDLMEAVRAKLLPCHLDRVEGWLLCDPKEVNNGTL